MSYFHAGYRCASCASKFQTGSHAGSLPSSLTRPHSRLSRRGFSLIDALVLCVAAVLVAVVVFSVFVPQRRRHHGGQQMQNSTQLRGIHQGIVTYSTSNNGHYPGVGPDGEIVDATVAGRFELLIDGDYFTPDYMVSPGEVGFDIEVMKATTDPVTEKNYSYAMLQIDNQGQRRAEWFDTYNPLAIIVSDRAVPNGKGIRSLHTKPALDFDDWQGTIVFNDNSTRFVTHYQKGIETRYGEAETNNVDDHLFIAASDDDAMMIHKGQ